MPVAAERKRVAQKVRQPETESGKNIKRLSDAPAGQIDKIIKDRATKRQDKFDNKGALS